MAESRYYPIPDAKVMEFKITDVPNSDGVLKIVTKPSYSKPVVAYPDLIDTLVTCLNKKLSYLCVETEAGIFIVDLLYKELTLKR